MKSRYIKSNKVRSGKLDKRLLLQNKTINDERDGSHDENWSDITTVWAGITPVQQAEEMVAKGISNTLVAIIAIRYRSDINTNCRGLWNGSYYNFKEVINVNNENRKLLITAEVASYES